MEVTRVVLSEMKSFKDTFENEDVTRDTEGSFLVVAVLLSRLVEEFHEDWMVEKFSWNDKPFHLVTDVDWDVTFRDYGGRRAAA
jgi:hypothetical protein